MLKFIRGLFYSIEKIKYLLGAKVTRSVYGIKLEPNFSDSTFKYYVKGSYGFKYAKHLSKISNDFVYLDIGANQGLYSILAAKSRFCHQVFAFEPVRPTFEILKRNLQINNVENIVHSYCYGISDSVSDTLISFNETHSGAASMINEHDENKLLGIKLRDVSFLNGMSVPSGLPVKVKVDVEGYELTVLREISKTDFFPRIDEIFSECDTNWLNESELVAFFKEHGFKIIKMHGNATHYDILATRKVN